MNRCHLVPLFDCTQVLHAGTTTRHRLVRGHLVAVANARTQDHLERAYPAVWIRHALEYGIAVWKAALCRRLIGRVGPLKAPGGASRYPHLLGA